MPRMINGVGTRFYGQCDWRRDGSFQTTEWFVLMYVPVMPLKSLRVQRAGGNTYRVFEELPVSVPQALRTWAFAALYIMTIPSLVIHVAEKMNFDADEPMRNLLWMTVLGTLLAAPFLVLKFARSKALAQAKTRRR